MSLIDSFTQTSCVTQDSCVKTSFIREKLLGSNSPSHPPLMHTYTFTYTRPLEVPPVNKKRKNMSLNKPSLLQTKQRLTTLVSTLGVTT